MPRPMHFEIAAEDPERAIRFYQSVFGWSFQKWEGPMEYWLVKTGEKDEPGIDGGLGRRQKPGESTTNVVGVASVDDITKLVERAGGTTVVPRSAVPGVGWIAYYQDPERNTFGVMQEDPNAA
jgi:uncharacterized protein